MQKKGFLKALTEVYCRIGVTTHGVGLVVIRTIPKGTDPLKNADHEESGVIKIPQAELDDYDCDEEAKRLVRDFSEFARQEAPRVSHPPDQPADPRARGRPAAGHRRRDLETVRGTAERRQA